MARMVIPRTAGFLRSNWITPTVLRDGCWIISGSTVFLMAVGGMTRVMDAGLACPDWPLCYGSVLPEQMDQIIFWEWFHRVIATAVGFMTLMLTGLAWWGRTQLPRWLPWATTGALLLVLIQGALGALTVTEFLRFDIVTAHLGTATVFLATLVSIALCLYPRPTVHQAVGYLPWIALGTSLISYGQILLGGLVASQWALHQCLGDDGNTLCQVMHNHLWGVAPTILGVGLLIFATWSRVNFGSSVAYGALAALALVGVQVGLGIATYLMQLEVPLLTVAHLMVGVGLLMSQVITTVLAFRAQVLAP